MVWKSVLPLALFCSLTFAREDSNCRCCNLSRVHPAYLANLPSPVFRKNIGKCSLKITTSSPEAQKWFNQGLAHLHGFWEFEAYRCFLEALKHDPECAMAYWGICMALPGKEIEAASERAAALEQANKWAGKVTPHEKLYLKVINTLITRGSRAASYELLDVITAHPADTNALAWWAYWSQEGYRNNRPLPSTTLAIKRIQEALKTHPDDIALNHYLIHILESGPDFEQGRAAANSLARVGGDSGHLTHMPGHIFYLAGEYQKTCQAFLKCQKVETSYLQKEKIPAIDHLNYLHNLHYLTQAAADHGNDQLAHETAKTMATIKAPPGREKSAGSFIIHYTGSTVRALPFIRAREFKKAADVLDEKSVPEDSFAREFVRLLKYNCLLKDLLLQEGPLTSEKLTTALEISEKQSEAINTLKEATPKISVEGQPLAFAQMTAKIFEAESKALIRNAQATNESGLRLASFYIAIGKDDIYTEPPVMITPVAETLAWFALSKGNPANALQFFEEALKKRRKSGHCYQGMALAHQKLGNIKKAQEYTDLAEAATFRPAE